MAAELGEASMSAEVEAEQNRLFESHVARQLERVPRDSRTEIDALFEVVGPARLAAKPFEPRRRTGEVALRQALNPSPSVGVI